MQSDLPESQPHPHQLWAVAEGVGGADLAGLAGQAIEVAGVAAHTQDPLIGAVLSDAALTDVKPDLEVWKCISVGVVWDVSALYSPMRQLRMFSRTWRCESVGVGSVGCVGAALADAELTDDQLGVISSNHPCERPLRSHCIVRVPSVVPHLPGCWAEPD